MDLTWGCQIVGWEKNLSNSLSLFIRKGFFCSEYSVILYQQNLVCLQEECDLFSIFLNS